MENSNYLKALPEQFFSSLAKKVGKAISEGRDVINLGQGNPDQPTPVHIVEALQTGAADPKTHGYSPFRGLEELREAVSSFYHNQYGVDVCPDSQVAILFGTKAGLVELPLCLLNKGDLMLLPDPGYPDYLSGAALAGAVYETLPLLKENGFLPDYGALEADTLEKAKLMYLNYPNNPTGATASLEFFEETVQFAKTHGITAAHDFAYGAIGFDGRKPVSFLQADGAFETGIELYTLSKTYNMAGWRVGFAVGNAAVIEAINLLQDHLYCSLFPAVQQAAAAALTGPQDCVADLLATYERRRETLTAACREIGWEIEAPAGSFFAWLPVPDGYTSEQFSDLLLDEANVAVAPGSGFGQYGEGYIRVGLLVEEDRLREAVQRIGKLGVFSR